MLEVVRVHGGIYVHHFHSEQGCAQKGETLVLISGSWSLDALGTNDAVSSSSRDHGSSTGILIVSVPYEM